MSAGVLITLEGGEGVGKSRLCAALAREARALGRDVVTTREPGGSKGADLIRPLLVRGEADGWSALSEGLLFSAARNDHLEKTVRPALARGALVLCDRYVDSTLAYQVHCGELSLADFDALNRLIVPPRPLVTLVLDLDPKIGLARSRGPTLGEDRFELRGLAFHQRVREAFLEIARADPDRCFVLDGGGTPEATDAAALALLRERGVL